MSIQTTIQLLASAYLTASVIIGMSFWQSGELCLYGRSFTAWWLPRLASAFVVGLGWPLAIALRSRA